MIGGYSTSYGTGKARYSNPINNSSGVAGIFGGFQGNGNSTSYNGSQKNVFDYNRRY